MLTQIIFYLLMSVNMQWLIMKGFINHVYQKIADILKVQQVFYFPSILVLTLLLVILYIQKTHFPTCSLLEYSISTLYSPFSKVFSLALIILVIGLIFSKITLSRQCTTLLQLQYGIFEIINGNMIADDEIYEFFEEISCYIDKGNEDYDDVLVHLNRTCYHVLISYSGFTLGKKNQFYLSLIMDNILRYIDEDLL